MPDDTDEKKLPPPTDLRTVTGKAKQVILAERKAAGVRLLNRGYSLREMAEALGITFGQAAQVARAVLKDAEKQFEADAARHRARMLHKNLVLQRECWDHLERAKQGHVRQELSEGGEEGARTRTMRENDLMAEARVLETLRKAQADEAKILGWVKPKDPDAPSSATTVHDHRSITIINHAGVPARSDWLNSIPAGWAKQGIGALPPGAEPPVDAEPVQDSPVSTEREQEPAVDAVPNTPVSAQRGQPSKADKDPLFDE